MNNDFKLHSIASWPGEWLLGWMGDLSFPEPDKYRNQPSVNAVFFQHASDGLKQKKQWFPIGLLPFLKVGEIWCSGISQGVCADLTLETFPDLVIDENLQLVKAGGTPHKDKVGLLRGIRYWLPLFDHPWHLEHTHSNCVAVPLPNKRWLLIPCMELVRFYFGSSSNLLKALFAPPLENTSLVKWYKQFDHGRVYLRLADGMSGASAADLARILYSPDAKKAARLIGSSCLQCANQGKPVYPISIFPFLGKTDLTVTGRWISDNGNPSQTFVVSQIISCTHPFPFSSLRYEVSPSQDLKKKKSISDPSPTTIKLPDDDPQHESLEIMDDLPSHGKTATILSISSIRFPDLENKEIYRNKNIKKSDQPNGNASCGTDGKLGIGEQSSTTGVSATEFENGLTHPEFEPDVLPEFIQDFIGQFDGDVTFSLVTPFLSNDYVFPIPILVSDDKPIQQCTILSENGEKRRRNMACLIVDHQDKPAVFLLLEPGHNVNTEVINLDADADYYDLDVIKKYLSQYLIEKPAQLAEANNLAALRKIRFSSSS
jgi:hypothetical protein